MLYLILAHDGHDEDAPERRSRVRPQHLEGIRPLVESGRLQVGGAILDDEGVMRGSMVLLEAQDEEEARSIVEADVYTREGVWRRFEIWPFKRAV